MAEVLYITERSAQVAEGYANGLTDRQLGQALHLDEETINSYATQLYHDLGISGEYANPRWRAIAMLGAAHVLQPTDQRLPHELYVSTMRPSPGLSIQYWSTVPLPSISSQFYMPPKAKEPRTTKILGEKEFSALDRTVLSCKSLGMSEGEMIEADIVSTIGRAKYQSTKLISALGVLNMAHAIAFGQHYGLITVNPEILERGKVVKPVHYAIGRTVFIDRPSYRVKIYKSRSKAAQKSI